MITNQENEIANDQANKLLYEVGKMPKEKRDEFVLALLAKFSEGRAMAKGVFSAALPDGMMTIFDAAYTDKVAILGLGFFIGRYMLQEHDIIIQITRAGEQGEEGIWQNN